MEENRAAVRELLLKAPEAELLVLPEAASATTSPPGPTHGSAAKPRMAHRPPASPKRLGSATAPTSPGSANARGTSLWNSAVVVGPTGRIGLYRKAHSLNERDLFEPGTLGFWSSTSAPAASAS